MSLHEISPEPGPSRACSTPSDSENIPPECVIKDDVFEWSEFLDEMGCHASNVPALWKHCTFMEQTVFDTLFDKGLIIFVDKKGAVRPALIVLTLGMECHVEYQDVPYNDNDWITLDQVVVDPRRSQELQRDLYTQVNAKLKFVNMKDVETYRDVLGHEIHSLIENGQYFEIIDDYNPQTVYVGKVVGNHCGIIVYSCDSETNLRTVHLSNGQCYPIGWALNHTDEFTYHTSSKEKISQTEMLANSIPSICFKSYSPETHSFQKGNLFEVLDAKTGFFTYPAYVSEIINSYYAVADVHTNIEMKPERIIITKRTPGIYPINFMQQHRVSMHTPLIVSNDTGRFSWHSYKNATMNPNGTPANENTLPRPNQQKVYCMQYIEYFRYDLGIMTPGLIVRSKLDSIWIATGLNKSMGQAMHCFVGSTNIFPIGFAEKYDIPFCATPHIPRFIPPMPENNEQSRYQLDKTFKCVPGPIFRKPLYSGRGRPEKTWHFMADWTLRGDNWVPPVKIARKCRIGPWLDPKTFAGLKDVFHGGNVADVVECLFKDFFRSTKPEHRTDVIETFDTSDSRQAMPRQIIKYRLKMDGCIMTVQACESCESYPGWLRTFLQCYGCCPNLLSFNLDYPCQEGCNIVNSNMKIPKNEKGAVGPDGILVRKKSRKTEIAKSSKESFSGRVQRHLDVPHFTLWNKVQLIQYLIGQNPHIKVQLKQLFAKKATVAEILQCRDAMSITRLGFRPKDATKIFEALNNLRLTQS